MRQLPALGYEALAQWALILHLCCLQGAHCAVALRMAVCHPPETLRSLAALGWTAGAHRVAAEHSRLQGAACIIGRVAHLQHLAKHHMLPAPATRAAFTDMLTAAFTDDEIRLRLWQEGLLTRQGAVLAQL